MKKMTKKTLAFLSFVLIMAVLTSVLVACGGSDYTGTYYAYRNGVKQANDWIKLEKDKWSDYEGESGRLEEKDGVLYGYMSLFGEEEVMFTGTVKDGAFEYTFEGGTYYTYYTDNSKAQNKDSSLHGKTDEQGGTTDTPTQPVQPVKTQYTVTFDSKGGSDVASKKVDEGEKLTAPTQPTKTMYIFNGWYKESNYTNVWDFDTDVVTKDITLYAKWQAEEVRVTSVNGATIDGNEITIIVGEDTDEMDMSDKVVLNSDTATWKLYYDKLGRDEIRTKIATNDYGTLSAGSNLFYIVVTSADETQSKTYTLDLYKKYSVLVSVYDVYDKWIKDYTVVTLDTLTAPEKLSIPGYTVNGWKSSATKVGSIIPKDSIGSIKLTPDATPNTYTVQYDAKGGQAQGTQKTVTFDQEAQLAIPTKMGHTFLGWMYGDSVVTEDNGKCTWKIAQDVTVTAQWRANRYSVTVQPDDKDAGSVKVLSNVDSVNLYFDLNGVDGREADMQTVTKTQGMTYPTTNASGYLFRGWYKESSCTNMFDFSAPISSDTTVYAGWYNYQGDNKTAMSVYSSSSSATANTISVGSMTKYCYFAALADGTYTVAYKNYNSGSNYGLYITIYDYTAGTTLTSFVNTSTSYSSYQINAQAGHIYYISAYRNGSYDNTLYTYCYSSATPASGGKVDDTDDAVGEYASTVTLEATTNNGYNFVGWYDGETKLSSSARYDLKVPAANKTYTAKWTYYTVTTNSTGGGSYTSYNEKKFTVGSEVTLTASTYDGYTWLGWYDGDEKVSSGMEKIYTFTMGKTNKMYTAKWISPIIVEKSINEAGMVTQLNGKYEIGDEVTVTAETNVGYIWLGWYEGQTKISEGNNLSYTFTMGTENKTYTAKWEVAEELLPFSFTSTTTTCTITGVQDNTVTNIVVPDYVNNIDSGAFFGCSSLESITIPFVGAQAGKTSKDTYQYPFGYIFGTKSYTGGTWISQKYYDSSTSSTTNSYYYIPSTLQSVTVTGGEILYGAFYNCSMLTSISLPNSVTSIGTEAFRACTSLTSITIPDSVTIIGSYAFYGCTSLTSITIPDSVTIIGSYAFYGCTSLTSVTIGSGVTSIEYSAFDNCISLTSVTIPDSVTSIGSSAFSCCYKLVEVYNKSSLNITKGSSDNGYVGCFAKAIYTEPYVSKLSTDENGYILYTDGEEISLIGYTGTDTELTLPAGITEINRGAFYKKTNITSITIPDSVTSIGTEAFRACTSLTSITIPDSVTSIGGWTFGGCISLTSITIPFVGDRAGVTSSDTDRQPFGYIFSRGIGNTDVEVSVKQYYYVSSQSYRQDTTYCIPRSLRSVTVTGGEILYGAFYNCSMLTSITIPDSVTSIGDSAFYNCSKLTSISLPDSVTSIGDSAFYYCTSLTDITIPDSVTSIGTEAFRACTSLTSITIPDSVTSIGRYAINRERDTATKQQNKHTAFQTVA